MVSFNTSYYYNSFINVMRRTHKGK